MTKRPTNQKLILADKLTDFVAAIVATYEGEFKQDADEATHRRIRHVVALSELAELVQPASSEAYRHIMELASALHDLSQGTKHPLLEATKFGNRAPDRTDIWLHRAAVVIALEYLMKANIQKKDAIAQITTRFQKSGLNNLLRGQSRDLASSIASWRAELRAGTCANRAAMSYFLDELSTLESTELSPTELQSEAFSRLHRTDLTAADLRHDG